VLPSFLPLIGRPTAACQTPKGTTTTSRAMVGGRWPFSKKPKNDHEASTSSGHRRRWPSSPRWLPPQPSLHRLLAGGGIKDTAGGWGPHWSRPATNCQLAVIAGGHHRPPRCRRRWSFFVNFTPVLLQKKVQQELLPLRCIRSCNKLR
jgi:hypothetical protein